ncbi:(Fe-S)-binding protein [bacterium]|nr:(Fe-S)-binding protein [bacterium]
MLSTAIWTIAFLGAIGFFLLQVGRRFAVLLKMRRDDGRNYTSATLSKRVSNTLIYAFGQYKFFRDGGIAGVLHIVVFWGFLTLGGQVTMMFARGWFPGFTLPEWLMGPYSLTKDFFQVAVLCAVGVLLYRWLVIKPQRLMGFLPAEAKLHAHKHTEAIVILCFIATIMISGFLYDAGRLVFLAGNPEIDHEAAWQPISRWIASLFGGDAALAQTVSDAAWWVHNGVILTFLNVLPRSKHFHIITAVINVFLGRVEPAGRIAKVDFTAEAPNFGRSKPMDFTWKQGLDMYSCTECGRCSAMCPATATGKPLAPRQFLLQLRDTVYAQQGDILKKKPEELLAMDVVVGEGKPVIDEVVWSCNTCRACEEACPVNIEYVDKIVAVRQHLVQEASRFPEELARTFKGLENNSNPWGLGAEEREAWTQGLDVPRVADNPNVEYLYYVGCGGALDSNNHKTTQSLAKILKQGKVSFGILGKEELCNGETARRLGNEYLFQTMAEALVTKINSTGIKKILVNCPHCFNTMTNEYPEFGGNWEVIRAGDLVSKLLAEGKIQMQNSFDKKIVYHDSCYYGRFNGVFEEPRNLLSQVPGARLEEMTLNKGKGTCCGAGGGRMWVEEKADQRVNALRVGQALEKKPDVIATSCPYCRIMIGNGVTDKGVEDQVQVMDVMQIVASGMKTEAQPV